MGVEQAAAAFEKAFVLLRQAPELGLHVRGQLHARGPRQVAPVGPAGRAAVLPHDLGIQAAGGIVQRLLDVVQVAAAVCTGRLGGQVALAAGLPALFLVLPHPACENEQKLVNAL